MKNRENSDLPVESIKTSSTQITHNVDPSRVNARGGPIDMVPDLSYQKEVEEIARGWQNRDLDD